MKSEGCENVKEINNNMVILYFLANGFGVFKAKEAQNYYFENDLEKAGHQLLELVDDLTLADKTRLVNGIYWPVNMPQASNYELTMNLAYILSCTDIDVNSNIAIVYNGKPIEEERRIRKALNALGFNAVGTISMKIFNMFLIENRLLMEVMRKKQMYSIF